MNKKAFIKSYKRIKKWRRTLEEGKIINKKFVSMWDLNLNPSPEINSHRITEFKVTKGDYRIGLRDFYLLQKKSKKGNWKNVGISYSFLSLVDFLFAEV